MITERVPVQARVRATIRAADPIDAAGLARLLRVRGIEVVDEPGDVLVTAIPERDPDATWLTGIDQGGRPSVLIMPREPDPDALAVCGGNTVMAVPRCAAGGEQFAGLVMAAANGQAWAAPDAGHVIAFYRFLEARHRGARRLTDREARLLRLTAEGLSTAQISLIVGRSPRAVRTDFDHLVRRLGLRNVRHAVAFAIRAGEI